MAGFARWIRAPAYLLLGTFGALLLAWIMQFLLQPVAAVPGAKDSLLYETLNLFTEPEPAVLIVALGVMVGLVYGAVVDRGVA
jgi:hypothetical protein